MKNTFLLILTFLIFCSDIFADNQVYFFNGLQARVSRANSDGTGTAILIQGRDGISGIDIHTGNNKLFWCEFNNKRMIRADLDGTNQEVFLEDPTIGHVNFIQLDNTNNKVYFTETNLLRRIDTDGQNLQTIITAGGSISGIGLNVTAGKVYWYDSSDDSLHRSNLDGSSPENLATVSTFNSSDMEVDPVGGKVYIMDGQVGTIYRRNLDGSDDGTVVSSLGYSNGFELDLTNSKIYISQSANVRRVNLSDGSSPLDFPTSIHGPYDFAIHTVTSKIYTTDRTQEGVYRSDLDGANQSQIVDGSPTTVRSIDFDQDTGDIYTAEEDTGKILRYNPDGTNQTTVLSGLITPTDVEVDEDGQKIYYLLANPDQIARSNLDGSSAETILATINGGGLAVDSENETLYVAESITGDIKSANLDGTGLATVSNINIMPSSPQFKGVAYSKSQAALFIAEQVEKSIYKVPVNGSAATEIITGLVGTPNQVEVDDFGQKVYWAENFNTIMRADYDGSNVETVLDFSDGVSFPTAVSLLFDNDNDGVYDPRDLCPADPAKFAAGLCGCGVADTDTDGDGTPDCTDLCDNDPDKIDPGTCGCSIADVDSDLDGSFNCLDACDNDPDKVLPGVCGCGTADGADTNGNSIDDCLGNSEVLAQATVIKRKLQNSIYKKRPYNKLKNYINVNSGRITPATPGFDVLGAVSSSQRFARNANFTKALKKINRLIRQF